MRLRNFGVTGGALRQGSLDIVQNLLWTSPEVSVDYSKNPSALLHNPSPIGSQENRSGGTGKSATVLRHGRH